MIHTIFVPLEISESDDTVIKYAIETAKNLDSRLVFFKTYLMANFAYPVSGMANLTPDQEYFLREEEELRTEKEQYLLTEFPELEKINYELYVLPGAAVDVITNAVEDKNADLIIIGTEGASGLDELFGTLSEKLTRHADCPVLVIPDQFSYRPVNKISLALDADNVDNELHLDTLFAISRLFKSTLDVVNVSKTIDEADLNHNLIYRRINKELEGRVNYFTIRILLQDDEEQALSAYTERNQIDMLTLVYREHGFFKRLFKPGLRSKLIYHSDIPLLILK